MRMLFNMAAPPSSPFETKMAAPGAMYNCKREIRKARVNDFFVLYCCIKHSESVDSLLILRHEL